jgi:DNA-cytosine methyltransferase
MNVLSLFDGIACARVAFDKAGIPIEKYYASEIDPDAMQIAQRRWKDIWEVGSIVGLLESGWIDEPIDFLIGGSPCQDLSIAKKGREGLSGKRSGLFYEYVRIKEALKPKWFVLENVASMPKEAKDEMTRLMGVEPIMINAALVSAQNRKRLFWTNIPDVKQPEDRKIFLKDILESGATDKLKSYCLDANYFKGSSVKHYEEKGVRQLVYATAPNGKEMEVAISENPYVFKEVRTEKGKQYRSEHRKETGEDSTLRGKDDKKYIPNFNGKANCITTGLGVEGLVGIVSELTKREFYTSATVGVRNIVRKLTPIECERLQGLPDNYTEGLSDSARYHALGNAFNVDVIAHILSFLP